MSCNQACPYNTLQGCQKDELNNGVCILSNMSAVQQWNHFAEVDKWIRVEDRLPETIPCNAGTAYSEAVVLWTKGRKVLTAIYNGEEFIADAAFWDAEGEEVTHWMPIHPPKEDE